MDRASRHAKIRTMNSLDRLVGLVPPPENPEDLSAAWRLASEFLGFDFPSDFVEFVDTYGSGVWGDNLVLYGPRQLFLFAEEKTARVEAGAPANIYWPDPGGALHIGYGWSCDAELLLVPHLAHSSTVSVFDGGRLEPKGALTDWLSGWIEGGYNLEGGPPEPPYEEGDRWRPRMTARAPLFVADKDTGEATGSSRNATARLLIRADLSPLATARDERLEILAATAEELSIDRRRDVPRPGLIKPPVPYRSIPWQRNFFSLIFEPHGGYWCWYDDAIDESGHHRIGCMYGTGEAERATKLLTDLAAGLGCTIATLEVI